MLSKHKCNNLCRKEREGRAQKAQKTPASSPVPAPTSMHGQLQTLLHQLRCGKRGKRSR